MAARVEAAADTPWHIARRRPGEVTDHRVATRAEVDPREDTSDFSSGSRQKWLPSGRRMRRGGRPPIAEVRPVAAAADITVPTITAVRPAVAAAVPPAEAAADPPVAFGTCRR